jgi:hypothetical protein
MIVELLPKPSLELTDQAQEGLQDYQEWLELHQWLSAEVLSKISISPDLQKLGFIGLINRTNTGGLTTALGRVPIEKQVVRHIQPVKAISRRLIQEKTGLSPSTPLAFLKNEIDIGAGVQLVKETIGPDSANPAEWLDSFALLLEAGVPPEKMFFVPTFRQPLETAISWMRMWNWSPAEFPIEAFNESFAKVWRTMNQAQILGVKTVPYVHEFLRDFGAEQTLSKMLKQLDLPMSQSVIDWSGETDPYWQGQIVKYDQPPDAWIKGSLSKKHGGRGGLIWKPTNPADRPSQAEAQWLLDQLQPAQAIYQQASLLSKQQLGLKQ